MSVRGSSGLQSSSRLLSPAALFLGVMTAFAGCVLAGRIAARHNLYKGLARFDPYRNPMTFYYPTVSQVRQLARQRLDKHRVAVVVGGNSILNGIGQRTGQLWTEQLQARLGDDYRVLNLAMLGAEPVEFGGIMAEILEPEYSKLIYITDLGSSVSAGLPDGSTYRYFYWDACYKGMLPPYPRRQRRLADVQRQRRKMHDSSLDELKAGRRLDALLYYQDLWTTWTYQKLSTVWAPLLRINFPRPRRALPAMYDISPLPGKAPPPTDGDIAIVRGFAESASTEAIGCRLPPMAERAQLFHKARQGRLAHSPLVRKLWDSFPPTARPRSLLLVFYDNPTCLAQLPPEARFDYRSSIDVMTTAIAAAGFAALAVGGDFSEDDFIDRCHLNEQGGRALARAVAPKVRALALSLGYIKETR